MKTHLCVPIDKALDLLKKGENIFSGTPNEAIRDLLQAQSEGKTYYAELVIYLVCLLNKKKCVMPVFLFLES